MFSALFTQLGNCFVLGGDFNAKHGLWGSRLTTPKGRELSRAINSCHAEVATARKPTYWPSDTTKRPDLIDFFILQNLPLTHAEASNDHDLSSDHSPVILSLSEKVVRKKVKQNLYNRHTDWDLFRENVNAKIDLRIKIKTKSEIDVAIAEYTRTLQESAKAATPLSPITVPVVTYPPDIREMVLEKRRARKRWQRTRLAHDKATLNRLTRKLSQKIKSFKNKSFKTYLENLDGTPDTDYSLWKACRKIKRPPFQAQPIRKENGEWAKSEEETASAFARHLERTFQPNDINSDLDLKDPPLSPSGPEPGTLSPATVVEVIQKNLSGKKAPGYDNISARILKELPKKGLVLLTNIFNAMLRLKYFPDAWKKAVVILIHKKGKPTDKPESYRPIALLPVMGKLFEKLLLTKIEPLIKDKQLIPDYQFGFRRKHATLEQVHSVVNKASAALEEKRYCCGLFLDVAQAFDRVWHKGLLYKLRGVLPAAYCDLICSYLENRQFQVSYGDARTPWCKAEAGVPQGSVLGPLLYVLYTADMPSSANVDNLVFADDTAILATAEKLIDATDAVQRHAEKLWKWTRRWKIQINAAKSSHLVFSLRHQNVAPIYINGDIVPKVETTKYLGLHLDEKLTWSHHIKAKCQALKTKMREYHWLLGRKSVLSLENKRLLYLSVIRPIWLYGAPLWSAASTSNLKKIQVRQNVILRTITDAYRYTRNADIHSDLRIPLVSEELSRQRARYECRLHQHVNTNAINLLDNSEMIQRLKRMRTVF
jgi:hypothetical protein